MLRQQLGEVGIGVDVRAAEWQTFYNDVVNGLSADVPAPLVEALLAWPGVEAIELNASGR